MLPRIANSEINIRSKIGSEAVELKALLEVSKLLIKYIIRLFRTHGKSQKFHELATLLTIYANLVPEKISFENCLLSFGGQNQSACSLDHPTNSLEVTQAPNKSFTQPIFW